MLTDKDLRVPLMWEKWTNHLHPVSHLLDSIHVISTSKHTYVNIILPVTEKNTMREAEPERYPPNQS